MDVDPAPAGTSPAEHRLVVPDLGLGDGEVLVSLWLVPEGAAVSEGDRIVELVAGGVTLDLEAPVSGWLVHQCVDEDAVVAPGDVLAAFRGAAGAAP
jgi:pyruvate/2-oxoglutarate dehydrogenase complex dihydrolipoamide acyltransferase (E2) component